MGAVFTVPVARAGDLDALPGIKIALVARAGRPLPQLMHFGGAIRTQMLTLLIGAEREALPGDVVAAADVTAHIPIATDSLNAAMAATIALYEVTRMAPDQP
jgi:TrmH family RNA methyltransferase